MYASYMRGVFYQGTEEELRAVMDNWWREETQGMLHTMVMRLGK